MNFSNFTTLFFVIGFIISIFYGLKAIRIFIYPEKNQPLPIRVKSWYIHQFWFNFVCSISGWFFLFLFISILRETYIKEITFTYILFALIGILGVVGLLPSILAGIASSLPLLLDKIIQKLK